jgi:hypothetical protein
MKKAWVYDPHSGGSKIPPKEHEAIVNQIESFAQSRPWYPEVKLKPRFKSQFCYIDTLEGDECGFHLCRLRHFNSRGWSMALFTYSNERYEPCMFPSGQWNGTIEEALSICEQFII